MAFDIAAYSREKAGGRYTVGFSLILALPPGGKGQRTLQCLDCERPDPLKTDRVMGWLKSELQPPK
jgi:hypothetical protein